MYGRDGSNRIPAHGKGYLTFEPGMKVPPAGLLEWLTRVPYPAKGDNTLRAAVDRKSDQLQINSVEWGIFCKDGVFSPEYVQRKEMKAARFSFDTKWKNFRLSLQQEADVSGQMPNTKLIVIKSSAIRVVLSADRMSEHSCTLIMHHSPSYEQVQARNLQEDSSDDEDVDETTPVEERPKPARRPYAGRQRRPAWDQEHQKTSGFTSRVMRFVFSTENLRNNFEDLLEAIGCPPSKYVELETDARRLYSDSKRMSVHSWLDKLESRSVAFQLARLYQNGLLVPKEVLSLRPVVENLLEKKQSGICADVLHQFAEELVKMEDRWYDRILKDTSYKRDLAQNVSFTEVLEGFVRKSFNRVDWKENYKTQIMQCLHVILTPTSMILEGPYPDQSNRPLR